MPQELRATVAGRFERKDINRENGALDGFLSVHLLRRR